MNEGAQAVTQVMVVDDSAVIRGIISRLLEADPEIEVVATASNGQVAINQLGRQTIDVVVLDIEMPVMDGLTALPEMLRKQPDLKVIMASTLTRRNAEVSLRALNAGAVDYVPKPTNSGEIRTGPDFTRELVEKVKAHGRQVRAGRGGTREGGGKAATHSPARGAAVPGGLSKTPALRPRGLHQQRALAIGSSTGGPQALFSFFGTLAPHLEVPIFVTQHMPATFTAILAEHISRLTPMPCREAVEGDPVVANQIYIAPGNFHMGIKQENGQKKIHLSQDPPENFCRPAVDYMLRSLNEAYDGHLLSVILTGMGQDGMLGAREVVARGGTIIAQDEATSVVWGMPGAVAMDGLCSAILPLEKIAAHVGELVLRRAA